MGWFNPAPAPPRTDQVCPAIRDRLRAAGTLDTILGGPNRIFTDADEFARGGSEKQAWGRGVVLLPRRNWESAAEAPGRQRLLTVMLRFDYNAAGGGHDPTNELERLHGLAFAQLAGWKPVLTHARALLPLYRRTVPTAPAYEPDSGLWFSYALYHLAIGPPT
jgi:hypothetical protein